jgi:hypothetical protein
VKKNTYPLTQAIALDADRKIALDKEFLTFYEQMQEQIKTKPDLKDLQIPLERVKDAVVACAHGAIFGVPMVTVEEPEDWKEAVDTNRPRPRT